MDRRPDATRPCRRRLYFAYGSNLHMRQMKRRCPNSRYIGRGRLSDYRWQINERGYANVLESPGHWVDGLVYEIDAADEVRLDINEGVSKNAYTKHYLRIAISCADACLYRRPVAWIVDKGGPAAMAKNANRSDHSIESHEHSEDGVLVYISFSYVEDSAPKDEYVDRINLGILDARALGIADDYIRNCIRPYIPKAVHATKSMGNLKRESKDAGKAQGGRPPEVPPRPIFGFYDIQSLFLGEARDNIGCDRATVI